jgi:hypothetical protein
MFASAQDRFLRKVGRVIGSTFRTALNFVQPFLRRLVGTVIEVKGSKSTVYPGIAQGAAGIPRRGFGLSGNACR